MFSTVTFSSEIHPDRVVPFILQRLRERANVSRLATMTACLCSNDSKDSSQTCPKITFRRYSSVGIATRYGMDGPGIESRWWARFSTPVQTGSEAHTASYTMGTGSLLARNQYSEGPATGHLDTGFSWFPCVYKQMVRRFPTFQVATTCFSCSPPDLNLLITNFIFCLHEK